MKKRQKKMKEKQTKEEAAAAARAYTQRKRRQLQSRYVQGSAKNTRSVSSSERMEELFQEVQGAKWDVITVSETWRPNNEVWESEQGHVVMESGKFDNKHGVAIIVNSRWRQKVTWVECVSERVIASSTSVNKQPITLVSTYMPLSGYPDHQVEKTYDAIRSVIRTDKSMKIIGGDVNAESGPGIGVEQASVGHYTLKKKHTAEVNG